MKSFNKAKNKTFKNCLEMGQATEKQARELITRLNNVSVVEEQTKDNFRTTEYDFMTSDLLKYEVKLDLMASKTNNHFCEFLDGFERSSGIATTEANYYIIFCRDVFYKIPIDELKLMTKGKRIVASCENSKGYLIPIFLFEPYKIN
jgi:hypothetical protein